MLTHFLFFEAGNVAPLHVCLWQCLRQAVEKAGVRFLLSCCQMSVVALCMTAFIILIHLIYLSFCRLMDLSRDLSLATKSVKQAKWLLHIPTHMLLKF